MKRLSIIALVLMLCVSASAQMPKHDPPDPRLDKKVTLEVKHTKLEEVAKSLSEQTGITTKAGTGERDWRVREQHVTIVAKDVPLSTVLDQLTKLHAFHVSREGKQGEWTYIIWQDKKSRDLEAEMLIAQQEADAKRAKETRQAMADLAKKATAMSPDEAKKLRDADPNLAYMGGTNTGRAFSQLLNSLSQTDYDLMLRGKRVAIPFSSLPPNLQKAAMDTATGGLAKLMGDGASDLAPLQFVISPLREDIAGELMSMGCGGAMALMGVPKNGPNSDFDPIMGTGRVMSVFLMYKPDSKFGKFFAQAAYDAEQGVPKEQIEKTLNDTFNNEQGMAEAMAHDSPTEKDPPTDPELLREVDLHKKIAEYKKQTGPSANPATVATIAEATGYTVMLESFLSPANMAIYLQPGKQPVYKILIALEKAGYTWTREAKSLRIRPEDWAIRRSYTIAESTIVYWRDRLEKQGYLTLDDLSAIVYGLTDSQIVHTLRMEPDIEYLIPFADHERGILRLHASLAPDQKRAISTKEGLRFSDLSDKQWDFLAPIIMDRLGGTSIADGFVTNGRGPNDELTEPDRWRFEVMAVGEDGQQHAFEVRIPHWTKEGLAASIEARKQAREAAAANAQQKPPVK